MIFRTDLALEDTESNRYHPACQKIDTRREDGCTITTLVVGPEEEAHYKKPRGTYITVELPSISDHIDSNDTYLNLVSRELQRLLPDDGLVLVAGLGNRDITPDALGPKTADQVLATRHVTGELEKLTGHSHFRPVVTVSPNVLGNTGMEAFELLEGLARQLEPTVIIAVDALAARTLGRLGCTVQLCDAGIAPGSGVGNTRPAISRETLGVPVIAVGVPTVVDATTLAADLLDQSKVRFSDSLQQQISPRGTQMVVTPREIDLLISRSSHLVAMAINTALNPFFDTAEFSALI